MWPKFWKKKIKYVPPTILKKWINDIPGGDLHEAFIQDDNSVWSAGGRYAHSSGSTKVTWQEFKSGKLDETIRKTMGEAVLAEMHEFIDTRTA